jgi:hypothetical protein
MNRDVHACPSPECIMEPRRGSNVLRTRPALLELSRAIYAYEHHLHTAAYPRSAECVDRALSDRLACSHLTRLWTARDAYQLAALNAPDDAAACKCNGTGFYIKGVCYGCHGKGWMSPEDVIRCNTYWNKYARVLP